MIIQQHTGRDSSLRITRQPILIIALLLLGSTFSGTISSNQQDALGEEARDELLETRRLETKSDRRTFVLELLQALHDQYGPTEPNHLEERRSAPPGNSMEQLLEAIGNEGDARRLIEWIRSSFSPAALPEVATQFVVSKLGSVNCAGLLQPDREDSLVPRFLLFNEHFVDVPFELGINPSLQECIAHGKLDPRRRTVLLVHGYLTGYTLVDGMTNIKNRLLDLNRITSGLAMEQLAKNAASGSSFVYTDDLGAKVSKQMFNVIIVDWFNGANPKPRANYVRSAVNAQVVGRLIARFLSALVVQCGVPATNMEIIAHSLGCHVSGFAGKAMNAAGHRLAKITHLDPVGLCFGRMFSRPRFRLSANDALETQAVHTSLNIFDNPLDGSHTNFLVNGGRDQVGCGGSASELSNSTTSSAALLFDPAAKFGACSHMRALDLFEEDHSSESAECQLVGYRCQSYDRFLAGKCGQCDAANSQCRLMGLAGPISIPQFRTLGLSKTAAAVDKSLISPSYNSYELLSDSSEQFNRTGLFWNAANEFNNQTINSTVSDLIKQPQQTRSSRQLQQQPQANKQRPGRAARMFGAPSYLLTGGDDDNELARRNSDRRFGLEPHDLIGLALGRFGSADDSSPSFRPSETPAESELSSTSQMPDATSPATSSSDELTGRGSGEPADETPTGGQKPPAGSLNGPLYFLGTGALASHCLNYYQFRALISEARLLRVIKANGLGSNRLAAAQLSQHRAAGPLLKAASALQQRVANANGRDMLHLSVKLTDSTGRFFKGFSMLEHARSLTRLMNEFVAPSLLPDGSPLARNEPMLELTMLLNTTRPEPRRVSEAIVSYYFHQVVLADRLEVNYMSNVSPEIRARFSSVLCPVAINDRHQLVRYVECRRA